jgi:hypothetical protein
MQVIHTKNRGDHTFIRTFASSDGRHIGALAGGGYAYLSGILVTKREDLIDLIPEGPDREAALAWWENKDQDLEKKEVRRVLMDVDGDFKWEDGSPIESAQSLIENFPRGSDLDKLLEWFHERENKKKAAQSKRKDSEIELSTKNFQESRRKLAAGRGKKEAAKKAAAG